MKRTIGYIGASDSSVAPLIAQAIKKDKLKGPILLIVSSQNRAMALSGDISFFCDKPVFAMPPRENLFMSYSAKSRENTLKRIEILKSMEAGEDIIVIAATPALMRKLPPVGIYNQNKIKLRLSDTIKPEELKKSIVKLGYEPMSMVESIGEFSSRGGIFDFYSPSQKHPVRIEFFGDEIDSIRTFDIETQRSVQSLDEITIYPARDIYLDREQFDKVASRIIKDYNERIEELMQFPNDNSEAIDNLLRRKEEVSDHIKTLASMSLMENYIQYFYDNTSFLWDYVNPKSGTILIEEPDKVEEYIEAQDKENKREFDSYYRTGRAVMSEAGLLVGLDDFLNIYSDDRVDRGYSGDRGHQIDTLGIIMPFAKKIDQIKEYTKIEDVKVRLTENYGGRMDRFAAGVTKYLGSGYRVSIVIGDETKINSIKEFLKENNIPDQNIEFLIGNISRGSEFYEEKLVYISEFDIFGKTKTVKRRKASSK